MINVDVMQDASEIVHYDTVGIPLYIRPGRLSFYPDMKALCHWHEDIELIYVYTGEMNYDINGQKILLKEGDCLIVNSRQMHYGYSNHQRDCEFICILFHPSVLTGSTQLFEKLIRPVMDNPGFPFLHLDATSKDCHEAAEAIKNMAAFKKEAKPAYELNVLGALNVLWNQIYKQCLPLLSSQTSALDSDLILQKKMVSFIHQHYKEPLTLAEIATAGSVSRSKCCLIFKRYLQQSPIDFLNAYRLNVSCNLLTSTDLSITEIATACGFNHLSYFSKIFLRKYGCTPSAYRKKQAILKPILLDSK